MVLFASSISLTKIKVNEFSAVGLEQRKTAGLKAVQVIQTNA
jgi:hypothetical protein